MRVPTKLPTDRRFGFTFCVVFLASGAYAAFKGHGAAAYALLFSISVAFGGVALTVPRILAPLNLLWFFFGELLGRIVSPLILGIIYFWLLVPIALVARLLGRDELHLKRRPVASYWISRNLPGPTGQSFTHQF
ncbi:SxtJ family membrane protein [Bradyrhizobium sp. B117]|uniref:SxtJ family membrane protein n=1 Tax=Bradyrhizobium sp. B117 TaxID=3140246 RepID=UPI0031837F66